MRSHHFVRAVALAAFLSVLSIPSAAHADWLLHPFMTLNGGSTIDENAGFGVSGGWLGRWFGGEGEAAWSPWFFGDDGGFRTQRRAATYTGTGLVAPSFGKLRPYGAFGLGVLRSQIEEVGGLATLDDTRTAMHAGGGVMWNMGRWSLRGDARYIRALDEDEPEGNVFPETFADFDFWRIGGGVAFTW